MSFHYVCYPSPLEATVTLTPDSGGDFIGQPYTHPSGRLGKVCYIPDDVPNDNGATIRVEQEGYVPIRLRGFLVLDSESREARFQSDDFALEVSGQAPPTPIPPEPPDGEDSPLDIINRVYEETNADLSNVIGCGKFTEDCCNELHNFHSPAWGHIDKDPGQNQYNGHAVDALMLLVMAHGIQPGVYDIIYSSASPEAKPAFNYAHPPDVEDWYYPAEPVSFGVGGLKRLKLVKR